MKSNKQFLLFEYLISSTDLWARCSHIVDPNYFDPEVRDGITFVHNYWNQYRALPDPAKVEAETGIKLKAQEITSDTLDYAADEVETFCKNKAIEFAIRTSPTLLEKKDFGGIEKKIREAISVSLHRDLGLDYFADPETRLRMMMERNQQVSTGMPTMDRILYGGFNRQEMTIFAAESGGGKSMMLLNMGFNFAMQQMNGVYITFELSEEVVAKRMDSMMSGVGQRQIFQQIDQVATSIAMRRGQAGKLFIKYMPATVTTTLDIRAFLAEFQLIHGWKPDFLIVDYIDLMAPSTKVNLDNLFIKDKYVAEELRSLAVEFDSILVTASQLNRTAVNQERHDHAMIGGGISKIQTADNVISIRQTEAMRNCGEISFQFMKTRSSNGMGRLIFMSWDPESLRITDDLSGKSKRSDIESDPASTTTKSSPTKNVDKLLGVLNKR